MAHMGSTHAWYIHKLIQAYDWYLANRTPFEMLGLFLAVLGPLDDQGDRRVPRVHG